MSATITLRHRDGTLTVTDNDTVRAIARAVETYERGGDDQQFRVRRSRNLAVRFRASQVDSINANGIDLTDVKSPVEVAAEQTAVAA